MAVHHLKPCASLAEYFEKSGDTQEALAARVGTTQATISRLLSGRQGASLSLAKRLSKATGVPIENIGEAVA